MTGLTCIYCRQAHDEERCPRVKLIKYRKNGCIEYVEFHEPPCSQPPYPQAPYYPYPGITWTDVNTQGGTLNMPCGARLTPVHHA